MIMKNYLLLCMMISLTLNVSAYDLAVDNNDGVTIYYNFINDGKELEVAQYYFYSGKIVIPESVLYEGKTYNVTRIGNKAFNQCSKLTSITIGNSVIDIGEEAFESCISLTSIIIPNSVTNIGVRAFRGCSGLTSLTIGNSVINIGEAAFENCESLTSIIIPNSVKSIGRFAFVACRSLTSLTIGNSVTDIGGDAFGECYGLTSVTIPNSVTKIGYAAFVNCTVLTSIVIPNSVSVIEWNTFAGCTSLTSVTIPNSITSIEGYAFENCSSLTSITLPNSVTSIGENAFDGCNLTSVISLIQNPYNINENTFSKNTIRSATLYVPDGTVDQYKSTEGWKGFAYIEDYNKFIRRTINVPTAGSLSSIIPESEKYKIEELTLTGEINSDDLGFLREMTGKERKNEGTKMSFKDTEGKLVSLNISKAKIVVGGISIEADDLDNFFEYAVTRDNEIPPRIFEDCKNLTNISISDDVYSIGSRAFHGTKWYDNQPDGLVYIGNMLYSYKGDMPSNTDVTIKDGTIGIACSAFSSCKNLVSVKIPNSIINIGGFNKYPNVGFDGAFEWCTGLKSIISDIQNPPVFEYSTFRTIDDNIYSNATLYVPTGTIDVYKSTEGWNNFTNIVDSDSSGINSVLLNEKKDAPAYNLNGRRLIQPQKGVNIIDGKKIIIR